MEKDERFYFVHMLDAGQELQRYVEGKTRQDYDTDGMFRRSVERVMEIIGEAARQVSQPMRNQYPQIPWIAIIGMRNRIVHDYLGLDPDIVWSTVTFALPSLVDELRNIVPPELRAES